MTLIAPRVELHIPSPDRFSGLTGWWRSEDLEGYANGASAFVWGDASGNGRAFWNNGTGTPAVPTVVKNFLNGRAVLRYDGTNRVLSSAAALGGSGWTVGNLLAAGAGTILVVFMADPDFVPGARLIHAGLSTDATTTLRITLPQADTFRVVNRSGGAQQSSSRTMTTDKWQIGLWQHDGGSIRAGLDDLDAANLDSTASGDTDAGVLDDAVGLGGLADGTVNHKGYIAEVIAYNRALTEQERQLLAAWLCQKYGLTYAGTTALPISSAWVDVSADVVSGVKADWGVHGGGPKDRVASPGAMAFDLDNSAVNSAGKRGYYSPGHASARVGFGIGTPARLVLNTSLLGDKVKWVGTVESIRPKPGAKNPTTAVNCVDWMEEAARAKLSGLPVQLNVSSDALFSTIVGAVEKQPPNGTSAGSGSDTYPFALDNTQDENSRVLQELQKLAMSEYGYVYVQAGTLVFEGRRRRGGSGSIKYAFHEDENLIGMGVSHGRDDVVNRVLVSVHPRRRDAAATAVLFNLGSSQKIERNTEIVINCPYRDPNQQAQRVGGTDLVTPVASTDYLFNTAADGSGSDVTTQLAVTYEGTPGGNSAKVKVRNNGPADGYVTKLQLRGRGLYDFEPVIADRNDQPSMDLYGENALGYDMPHQTSPSNALDLAQFILSLNKDADTRVETVTFVANWDDAAAEAALTLELSERVSVTAPTLGLDTKQFFVNGAKLDVRMNGVVLVTWDLAPVDTSQFWVLEVAGKTELDKTTVLGYGLFVAGWILDQSTLGTNTFLN